MFHTQEQWREDKQIDVFRALSGDPTRQRFSVVEVFADTPTYEVKVAFLSDEGEQCWRKFLCTQILKVVEFVLGQDVVMAQVSINSQGKSKDIVLGELILELFEYRKSSRTSNFFCVTSSGKVLSDEIDDESQVMPCGARLIWRN